MTPKQIEKAFKNKLVGTKRMKYFISSVLSKMPDEIIYFITQNCWFIGSLSDAWAFTFTGDDLKSNHLIFISDELLDQPAEQIRYTVAHEIGHVILKHRNSVFEKQSKEEIRKQEKEAHDFALFYLNS